MPGTTRPLPVRNPHYNRTDTSFFHGMLTPTPSRSPFEATLQPFSPLRPLVRPVNPTIIEQGSRRYRRSIYHTGFDVIPASPLRLNKRGVTAEGREQCSIRCTVGLSVRRPSLFAKVALQPALAQHQTHNAKTQRNIHQTTHPTKPQVQGYRIGE